MKTSKTVNRVAGLAAITTLSGACVDLDVTNLNDPDRERAIASPTDVESLISGGYQSWWSVSHYSYPAAALSTAADAHSSSWGNWGMRDSGWEPRKAYNNDPAYSYNNMAETPWQNSYRALAAVRDGLLAIEGGVVIQEGDGPDNTTRAVAFGKFIQALSLSNLAVLFDKAFVVDEMVEDVATLELQPYDQVWAAAEAKYGEVVQLAGGAGFTIPSTWVGFNGDWSASYLAELARAYRARYRTQVARTPGEREAVDWGSVLSDVSAGLSKDFAGYYEEGGNWAWHRAKHHIAHYTGWARIDYRTVGPADASGEWEKWVAAGPNNKVPFDIDTDDRRITAGAPNRSGKYIRYMGNSPFPADRGIYHYSNYIDWRWRPLYANGWVGEYPDMTNKEFDFLTAEASYRMGNRDAAMAIVNKYRANGELPAFEDPDGVAPGGDRCVPQLPSGACGNLFDALKYEKRIELFHYGFGTEYFDDRGWGDLVQHTFLQLPIPGSELEILLQEVYTFGGPGGESTAPDINDVSPRALRAKAIAMEYWRLMEIEQFDDMGPRR
ncbi:MAG: hypothetical protein OXN18_03400 [Gemmatimonadota bacterium]|nr:hypothetical protein [Gemmatimonadota bacterium]